MSGETISAGDSGMSSGSGGNTNGRGGRGRANRGNRGNRNNNRSNNGRNGSSASSRFDGREASLRGHIYDFAEEQNPQQFVKTTEEVTNWVGREYKEYTKEFVEAVRNLELDDPDEPDDPVDPNDRVAVKKWELALLKYSKKKDAIENFKAGLYAIVYGQCTNAMESRLKSHANFEAAQGNGIALLLLIQQLMCSFEELRYPVDARHDLKKQFFSMKQGGMDLKDYWNKFTTLVTVLDSVGITIPDEVLINEIATANARINAPNEADRTEARERTLAMCFLSGTNQKHASYVAELRNAYLDGNNNYPKTLSEAYGILQRRVSVTPTSFVSEDGIAFATTGTTDTVPGTDGRTHPVACNGCHRRGHYSSHCPNRNSNNNNSGQQGNAEGWSRFLFSQSKATVPRSWILLDNQSTVDVVCNKALLENVRPVGRRMYIHCNAGTRWTEQQGDLPGYGPVWYCPQAIANILSLHNVSHRWRVTYDSWSGNGFVVAKDDGSTIKYCPSTDGLHYYETNLHGTALVTTVHDKKSRYTNDEYTRATRARSLQIRIGRPSTKEFLHIVATNLLHNCPVTKQDIMAAEDIFGPDVGSLKGKTTRRRPHKVDPLVSIQLPPSDMERYREVTVCADLMHVNGIPFLVTISRNLKFGTIEALPNRRSKSILAALKSMIGVYKQGGFRVRYVLMDNEFQCLEGELRAMGVMLNCVARDEHVPEIERYIRTVKERMRCTYNTVPFQRLPARLVIELGKQSVFWLNAFPAQDGISNTLSPRTIVTGRTIDHNRHCKYEFGEYVQTHEEHDNSMAPRTAGALALRPTGNAQGGYYFFSLSTGRVLNRNHATRLPMPQEVIAQVHRLARRQKANPGLVFTDRANQHVDVADDEDNGSLAYDSDEDSDYYPDDDDDSDNDSYPDDDDDSDSLDDNNHGAVPPFRGRNAGVVRVDDATDAVNADDNNDDDADDNASVGTPGVEHADDDDESMGTTGVNDNVDDDVEVVDNDGNPGVEGADDDDVTAAMDSTYGPRTDTYDLRPRRPRDYSHLHTITTTTTTADSTTGLATAQVPMKQGIKMFGQDGINAVGEEMLQLHNRKVGKPTPRDELTPEQRKEALAYLMFLKRKRSGKIKGRGCADGRKQRAHTVKADATAPTVSTEAVFLTAVIDAMEERDVATVDIPGAFMQADMDELLHVRLTGLMVDLLLEIDREMYEPYVVYEKNVRVMYIELLKALYGTVRAARLFWQKLSTKLAECGFIANPYDPCVMNKLIEGKQCTVCWHVDDLKISHKVPKIVDSIIVMLNDEFGKEMPLTITRGKVHDYLGMLLDFTKPGELTVDMVDYVKTVIADMPEEMIGTASTPATRQLFQTTEHPDFLDTERGAIFHRMVMQLLYLSQRARPDLRPAVSFLCKRTTKADRDDWHKLTRVMRYLQSSDDLKLRLSADGSGQLRWWVDASFGVHVDMKGHTGGTLSMGKGSIYSTSAAQKLVTRSSTECEVVGAHDVLPQIIWTANFLKAQGQNISDSILYQDNLSAMFLENNGRASSSKRTRHMNLRYFFIKDQVDNANLAIEHCPTGEMLADFFTKPLQGQLFFKFRDAIMHIDPSCKHHSGHRSVLNLKDPGKIQSYKDALIGA